MALTPGTRLGPYEILAPLGAGGMGQVYRARDTKLNRDVAVKVLPDSFANDPDRLARFTREAQTLAALNHPNIAHIHGLEESGGVRALVMELVEGDDLSDKIRSGVAGLGSVVGLPVEEALAIAKQIAEALEAAHEQGIVHRDLKPANIRVRADGMVKVLDFGLAKAMDLDQANSPTITAHAMTKAGMILGTAAYMSPEQARGKTLDKRADIWSFGCVLFEMLTGRRAFAGEDIADTMVSVVSKDPDWSALPASTPAGLRRLLVRCLKKDAKARMRDIGEARLQIEDLTGGAPYELSTMASPPLVASRSVWARVLPWAVAAAFAAAAGSLVLLWAPWRTTPVPAPRKLLASIGANASLATGLGASAILSPDGTTLAFVAQQENQTRLFIRKLDQLQAGALAGTDGADSPFFSPDGQWIAFFAGGKLKKVAITGGAAVSLCDAPTGRGGTWADDDTILFAPSILSQLMRVPAAGGTPVAFGTLSQGAITQRWPQALPGGTAVLYTEHSSAANFDGANLVVAPLAGGTPRVVVRGGHYGRYLSSGLASPTGAGREVGHLIYLNQGTLVAVRFDRERLETIGRAVPAIEGVTANTVVTGGAQLAVSSDGTLVYVPGTAATGANPIDWLARDGKTSMLRATKADWRSPRFSPDGQKLALEISDGKQRDIWVYEWARDTLTQLTFDPGEDRNPVWTPDGRRIVFASDRATPNVSNLYWVNADGTGHATRLTDSSENQTPWSWHPSGKFLAFHASAGATGNDLMVLPMERDAARMWTAGKPNVFLGGPEAKQAPMFSPDGRWIAYTSAEAGGGLNFDVYVRPFPGPGGTWRVSTAGGRFPRWSAATQELLFLTGGQPFKLMAAPYAVVGESFRADTPQLWSPTSILGLGILYPVFDLHPDGKRVAAAASSEQVGLVENHVVFVFSFADYLRKIAPGTR